MEYKDTARSFKGRERYSRLRFRCGSLSVWNLCRTAWPALSWAGCRRDCLQKPKIAIKLMRMAKPDQGCIDYRLTGKLAGQDIDIDASAKFHFSLTTGAVLRHEESYGYERCAAAEAASCATLQLH